MPADDKNDFKNSLAAMIGRGKPQYKKKAAAPEEPKEKITAGGNLFDYDDTGDFDFDVSRRSKTLRKPQAVK